MKKYWPLLLIVIILVAIVCMAQYADSAKHRYEESAKKAKAAAVAKGDDAKATNNAEDAYKPPVWAKFFTWPEGVGAWAVILTLLAIAWQSVETRAAAKATEANVEAGSETAERQLRAYLCIAYSELRFLGDGTIEPVLHLKNCGITPAYKVSSWQRGRLREYPLQSPLEPPPDDLLKGVAVIPPNHHHVATAGKIPIPQFMLDSLETKKFAFYVYVAKLHTSTFSRESEHLSSASSAVARLAPERDSTRKGK